jgi:hypothetical protein
MRIEQLGDELEMDRTTQKSRRQGGPVESARPAEHKYSRTPDDLWRLPATDRVAAVEVWTALHHFLRLGSTLARVTDEDLAACPCLADRSGEHIRKGIQVLDREGLIVRKAAGSRRELAIAAKLRGAAAAPEQKPPAPTPKPVKNDAFVPVENWSSTFWSLVSENQQAGT